MIESGIHSFQLQCTRRQRWQVDCGKGRETGHKKAGSLVFASISLSLGRYSQIQRYFLSIKGTLDDREDATPIRILYGTSKSLGRAESRVQMTEQKRKGRERRQG